MRKSVQYDLLKLAPGLEIIHVRLTKPKIPEIIKKNYEMLENERSKVLISLQQDILVAEMEKEKAVIEAEKIREIAKIDKERKVLENDIQPNSNS